MQETCERLADLAEMGCELIVVHGNGPQVGAYCCLRGGEGRHSRDAVRRVRRDESGLHRYHLQQSLGRALKERGINTPVVTLLTQMVVDADDPGFKNPTKPIGPFYSEQEAQALAAEKGYTMKEDAGRGWRRVVASPIPAEIVELDSIKELIGSAVVITCGGGGDTGAGAGRTARLRVWPP